MPKEVAACACRFMRKHDSQWEDGIAIMPSNGLYDVAAIYDMHAIFIGKFVYKYELTPAYGSFTLRATES